MKNIHILPTDQPTSVLYGKDDKYKLANSTMGMDWFISSAGYKPQHIYITSDEEIKEGVNQWYLDKFLNKPRNSGGAQYGEKQNIIILTTDPTLIKDGVQAIHDELLEWFVKNSSCEFVKVTKLDYLSNNQYRIYHLPQEELKSFSDFSDKFFGTTEKEESKQTEIMYSEQEVLDLLYKRDLYLFNRDETKELELPTEWFEQFKKK